MPLKHAESEQEGRAKERADTEKNVKSLRGFDEQEPGAVSHRLGAFALKLRVDHAQAQARSGAAGLIHETSPLRILQRFALFYFIGVASEP